MALIFLLAVIEAANQRGVETILQLWESLEDWLTTEFLP